MSYPRKKPAPLARVYIAGPEHRRDSCRSLANALESASYSIGSNWHHHPGIQSCVDPERYQWFQRQNWKYLLLASDAAVWCGSREEWAKSWEKPVLVDALNRGVCIPVKRFDDDAAVENLDWDGEVGRILNWLKENTFQGAN